VHVQFQIHILRGQEQCSLARGEVLGVAPVVFELLLHLIEFNSFGHVRQRAFQAVDELGSSPRAPHPIRLALLLSLELMILQLCLNELRSGPL